MSAFSDVSSFGHDGIGQAPPRRAFIGREDELRQLRSAFEAATLGDGGVVLLVGEPGIGKTALCERLAAIVGASGGRALVGHCYQQASTNLPYQPFLDIFEQCASVGETSIQISGLSSNPQAIDWVGALADNQIHLQGPTAEDTRDDRRRFFAAVLASLRRAATSDPLLLVLEDLHDADRGTLDLLVYLAPHLKTCRVLVLGTYRDVEIDRSHPLSAALADLRRISNFALLHLSGLSMSEMRQLLVTMSGQTVLRPLAELLHRRTDGNALFASELLRYLIAEGLIEQRDGVLQRVRDQNLAGRMPDGLRDTVAKRVSQLSANARRVLSIGSVIGREFDMDVLYRVDGRDADALEQGLEEAVAVGILEEGRIVGPKVAYHFTHAFLRQTLYEEIIAPRRIRLHQQIARVLEVEYARRREDHAAELAEHYAFSSDTNDLAKALHYVLLAAKRASDIFAYGEAARHLERGLQLLELVDSDDHSTHCDLHLELAEALSLAGDTERALTFAAPQALTLAERIGDRHRAFRACHLVAQTLEASGGSSALLSSDYLAWAERAVHYAELGTVEQARANLALAQGWVMRGRLEEARALRLQALALTAQLDDRETRFQCAFYLISTFGSTAPRYWPERVRLAKECVEWPRQGASGGVLGRVLWHAGRIALADGDRRRAVALWNEVAEVANRTHVGIVELFKLEADIVLAMLEGHVEQAWWLAERFVEHADEAGLSRRGREISMYMFLTLAEYLGRTEECLAKFEDFAASGLDMNHPLPIAYFVVCLARLGRMDEARARAAPVLTHERAGNPEDPRDTNWLVMLLQSAIVLEEREAARALSEPLVSIAHLSLAEWIPTTVARQLAAVSRMYGETGVARAYYVQALDAAERIGFRPETAITRVQLAELLIEQADYSNALSHLGMCISELDQMGMRPWLERALELRDRAAAAARAVLTDSLTRREHEVARLLAEGLTNRQIAEQLVISESTAEVHVKRILSKLGFHSRSQIAPWLAEHNVLPYHSPTSQSR